MTRLRNKNLEFIRASKRRSGEVSRRRAAVGGACALPAAFVVILLIHSLWQWHEIRIMRRETNEIGIYLEREGYRESVKEVRANQNKLNLMNCQFSNLEYLQKMIDSYPEVDAETASLVAEPDKVSIEEASFEQGILEVMAVTEDYKAVAAYIKRLEESGRFETVVYKGFEHKDQYQYRFQVTCMLKAGEDPERQQEGKGKS